jgi:hypothetical protein
MILVESDNQSCSPEGGILSNIHGAPPDVDQSVTCEFRRSLSSLAYLRVNKSWKNRKQLNVYLAACFPIAQSLNSKH